MTMSGSGSKSTQGRFSMSEKIVLIDGHSILNRAFFGVPPLTNSEGLHTNAVYGFLNIMFKILDEEKPDYLTVAFDRSEPTFRHQMFDAYKGTRKPMAQELREQVPVMKEVLQAMGIKIVEMPGYEADDLLGTIAGMAEVQGMDVSIKSFDELGVLLPIHQFENRMLQHLSMIDGLVLSCREQMIRVAGADSLDL